MLVRGDIPYALAAVVNIKPQPIKTGLYSTCFPQRLLKMYGSYHPLAASWCGLRYNKNGMLSACIGVGALPHSLPSSRHHASHEFSLKLFIEETFIGQFRI